MSSDTFSSGEDGTGGKAPGAFDRLAALLPFGLHPRNMLRHGGQYGFGIFWWFSVLGLAGLAVWAAAWRKTTREQRAYLLVAALVTAWLVTFYGSWYLRDHVDPSRVTIGTSYVRYFLPAYVAALPWVAIGLLWLVDRSRPQASSLKPFVMTALLAAVALLTLRVAVFSGDESLMAVRRTLEGNAVKRAALLEAVREDAVIMTERFDKVFFPERMRFMPKADEASFEAAEAVARYTYVFWYGLAPSDEEFDRLAELAERHGFVLMDAGGPVPGEALFLLVPVDLPLE